ncbi:hypothetical protein D9758_018519 [Tetrapyrgos nigripes]|uniref:Novel STAND NTPase 1 domain-containing protein n=1 Tax=Tetrapyrgos nigripes TaxID=182062 RepID=A0A8H5BZG6_9AGAR|nr:hypothetical protein D9758_018519 [Tetrapyrgos nigripes]
MSKRIGKDPGGDSRHGRQEDTNASKKDKSNKERSRISDKFARAFSSLRLGSKEESESSRIQERAPAKEPSNSPEQGNISTEWFREAHNFSINNSVINNHMIGVAQPQPTPQKVCENGLVFQEAHFYHVYPWNQGITHDDMHFATPSVPKIFTGRDDLVNEGVKILCKGGQNHLAILGPGGIGKTSLALVISNKQEVQEKFQDRHFLPCDILQDQNDLVQGFIQALGLKAQEGKSQHEILFDHLSALQAPALFILDNFETPWNYKDARTDVSNFIKKLVRFNHVTLIVTMRGIKGPGHPDIRWNRLGAEAGIPTLPIEAAREAFYLISGKSRAGIPQERLDYLLNELDCVPLAIRLVAQLAERIDLENLIRMWDKSKTEILSEPDTEPGKLTSVEYSIELMQGKYSEAIETLSEARDLFQSIGNQGGSGLGRETGWSKVLTAQPHTTSTITYTPLLPLPPNPCDNANANRIPFRITYLLRVAFPFCIFSSRRTPYAFVYGHGHGHGIGSSRRGGLSSQAMITFEN